MSDLGARSALRKPRPGHRHGQSHRGDDAVPLPAQTGQLRGERNRWKQPVRTVAQRLGLVVTGPGAPQCLRGPGRVVVAADGKWPMPTSYGRRNLSPSATTAPRRRHRPQPRQGVAIGHNQTCPIGHTRAGRSPSATIRAGRRKWPMPTSYGRRNLSPSATTAPGRRHRPRPHLSPSATTGPAGRDRPSPGRPPRSGRSRRPTARENCQHRPQPGPQVAVGHHQGGRPGRSAPH